MHAQKCSACSSVVARALSQAPLVFWILIGSGLTASFRLPGGPEDLSYLEYFFPGTVVLLVLFAAIFSTISVIEDRHEGFLQAVLVAPHSAKNPLWGLSSVAPLLAVWEALSEPVDWGAHKRNASTASPNDTQAYHSARPDR